MSWLDDTYSGTEWVEYAGLEWNQYPEPFYLLKQIWTDSNYVYAATTDGLNIIDIISELSYAHITYEGGFNSVWADSDNVYLATPASGIKYIEKTCISGSIANPYELVACLTDYLNEPNILSNKVRYIHGNYSHMIISTASGIDYKAPNVNLESKHYTKFARKVFVTKSGKIYYTTWDGNKWRINIKNSGASDWTVPDKTYETGTVLISSVDILDIFVTEGTSNTGINNTIFLATTSGIFVIDEETNGGDTYYTQ